MENGRGRKRLESVARFSLAGWAPPAERRIGERKKRNVNALSLLRSFSHFSSSSLSPLPRGTPSRYTLIVFNRFLLSSLKFLSFSFSLLRPSIFITLASLTSVSFSFAFRSWAVLLVFLLLEALLLTYACTLYLSFIFVYCLTLYFHTRFVSLFPFLPF